MDNDMVVETAPETTPAPTAPRYFWSGWFSGSNYRELATLFALLSAVDLLATTRMMEMGVKEGNALADYVLKHYGLFGFAGYKTALVVFILGLLWLVHRRNPAQAIRVIWFANILMAVIALLHLSIISGMFTGIVMK